MKKELLFTTGFHPNELVAKYMAGLVARHLSKKGFDVKIVDIEENRWNKNAIPWALDLYNDMMQRFKYREQIIKCNQNRQSFDFHDSDLLQVEEFNSLYRTSIKLPTIEKERLCHYVEVAAIYEDQKDPEISKYAELVGRKSSSYFSQISGVRASKDKGLLKKKNVVEVSDLIVRVLK